MNDRARLKKLLEHAEPIEARLFLTVWGAYGTTLNQIIDNMPDEKLQMLIDIVDNKVARL